MGDGAKGFFEDDVGFNDVAGEHRMLNFELEDLGEGEMGRGVADAGGSPQGTGGLRGAFDEENAGHEGFAGKVIGKKRETGIKPFPATSLPPCRRDGKGIEKGKAGAVGSEVHVGVRLSGTN